ncbi:MAG: hypothetical protein R3308_01245 [Thiohalobacterales bacterium]|nr:hypothetical protein [Thiohalobacterales bacterium]
MTPELSERDNLEDALDAARMENFHLRRELLRQRQLAQESEAQLRQIESSALFRYTAVFRLFGGLFRYHLKGLVQVGLIGLVALPLLPLLVVMVLLPWGRAIIWRVLKKVPDALDILVLIKTRLFGNPAPTAATDDSALPLIYHRPADDGAIPDRQWSLLQQVSPHKRVLLDTCHASRRPLASDTDDPLLQSLSVTESSMIRIAMHR